MTLQEHPFLFNTYSVICEDGAYHGLSFFQAITMIKHYEDQLCLH